MAPTPSIVVGTDFSRNGNRAVARASQLADQLGLRLVTTHVVNAAHISHGERDERTAEAMETLEMNGGGATAVRTHLVRVGAPHEELARAAETESARAIVVGIHQSKHSLEGFLVGSTAERVLRSVHCSVLLARSSASRRYRTVLVPVDLGESTPRLLQLAKEFFPNAKFLLVHCIPAAAGRRNHRNSSSESKAETASMQLRLEQLATAAGLPSERVKCSIATARDPRRRIIEIAKFHDADVIVMGTHARGGLHRMLLGSTADYVVRAAATDVLVMPPPS